MKRLLVAVVAASLLLAACEKPEDKFVGKYDGAIDMPPDLIEAIMLFAMQGGDDPTEVEDAIINGTIALELHENGKCTMTNSLGDNSRSTTGTWTLNNEGTQITIHVERDEQTAAETGLPGGFGRDRVLDISNDGKTLTFEDTVLRRTVKTTFTRK